MSDITTAPSEATTAAERPDEPDVAAPEPTPERPDQLIEAELLVEDVSIDGMCGVY